MSENLQDEIILNKNKVFEYAKNVISDEINGLQDLLNMIGNDAFYTMIEKIINCQGKVVISGVGKSGHIGRKISATLASTGTPSFFIHPSEASHGDLGMIETDDIVIAISNSGGSKEFMDVINYCNRFSIYLITFTSNPDSYMAKGSNLVVQIPQSKEACPLQLAPTTSMVLVLALGDALAISLLRLRNFDRTDFLAFHPGGKLGSQLKHISEFMHKVDDTLIANINEDLDAVLKRMNLNKLGCIVMVDGDKKIHGILTDGDIRRSVDKILAGEPLIDLITKQPRTINVETTVGAAMAHMEELNINALVVVNDAQQLQGVLHIQDCLRAGGR